MKPKISDEEAFALILKKCHRAELARRLGVSRQLLTRWKAVPLDYAVRVAEAVQMPKAEVLPSVFD